MCFSSNSATGFPVLGDELSLICLLMLFTSMFPHINNAAGFTVLDVKVTFICVLMIFMSNLAGCVQNNLWCPTR